jgi:hypothetical protein
VRKMNTVEEILKLKFYRDEYAFFQWALGRERAINLENLVWKSRKIFCGDVEWLGYINEIE